MGQPLSPDFLETLLRMYQDARILYEQEEYYNCCYLSGYVLECALKYEFSTIDDLKQRFYPLKAFSFIFDPKKFLILGQKGVGKTALFSALKNKEYACSLAQYLGVSTEQYERMEWIVGASNDSAYRELATLIKSPGEIRSF